MVSSHIIGKYHIISNIRNKFNVQINIGPNDNQPSIFVAKSNGKHMNFKEFKNRLYIYDASDNIKNKDKYKNTLTKASYNYSLVSTVKENKNKFNQQEIRGEKW